MKQNNHNSKRHGERKEITATTNLLRFSALHNFCAATTQGIDLCIVTIAPKHDTLQRFLLKQKQKNTPRGVLSSNQILAVVFKTKLKVFDWSRQKIRHQERNELAFKKKTHTSFLLAS